ncbi:MAG: porin family protein [Rhizobiaceae bacterium]|nr:porin family protein [Rhizobiaceae bacterium]
MRTFKKTLLITAAMIAVAPTAFAADMLPNIVEAPREIVAMSSTGWYLRGDIGYATIKNSGVLYYQGVPTLTGEFEQHDFDHTWMLGGGIGYQVTDYFRVDATLNQYFNTSFNGSSAQNTTSCGGTGGTTCNYFDNSDVTVTTALANAYFDLGTYSGFTPYVGAGIGGAKLHWGDLKNIEVCASGCGGTTTATSIHSGTSEWRFAYAFHAGTSYDISANLKLDAGYSYTHVEGGTMFNYESGSAYVGQQGFDGDMDIHAFKVGLRYQFGGVAAMNYDDGIVYK